MDSIIQNIRERRRLKGYSHENMARELHLSQAAYTKIENRETKLTVERLFQIAGILNTSVAELMNPDTAADSCTDTDTVSADALQYIRHLQQEALDQQYKYIAAMEEEIKFLRTIIYSIGVEV